MGLAPVAAAMLYAVLAGLGVTFVGVALEPKAQTPQTAPTQPGVAVKKRKKRFQFASISDEEFRRAGMQGGW